MSDIVISVENVSKIYRLGEVGTGSLAHDVNRWWHRIRGKEDPYLKVGQVNDRTKAAKNPSIDGGRSDDWVYALKDISFQVKRGEVLGIIGRNGAGKSTLLKILSRVTTQTSGKIKVKGRIASLLEVGTGFTPELTGRENVFLNGAILGMRRTEIASKFDEIVDFSGCARYIDTPVKRYSSGMYVRLAFAVAAHLDPETLIVDEVLAVGDASFQKVCQERMRQIAKEGTTILLVSHNLDTITRLCSRAILLHNGNLSIDGSTTTALRVHDQNHRENISTKSLRDIKHIGNGVAQFDSIEILDKNNTRIRKIPTSNQLKVRLSIQSNQDLRDIGIAITFSTVANARVISTWNRESGSRIDLKKGANTVTCCINQIPLRPGHKLWIGLWLEYSGVVADSVDFVEEIEGIPSDEATEKLSTDMMQGTIVTKNTWFSDSITKFEPFRASSKLSNPLIQTLTQQDEHSVMYILKSRFSTFFNQRLYKSIYNKFHDYTMIPESHFVDNLALATSIKDIVGCIVECGVWRGGMSAGMASLLGPNRTYYLFDSFEGLPPAKEIDGSTAIAWQNDTTSKTYFDNCSAPLNFANEAMKTSKACDFHLVKGWFSETLPKFPKEKPIALLRLDGDWYESTWTCLEFLYRNVTNNGIIIIDDYYTWDGCTRAVHDFLSKNSIADRIRSTGKTCYIVKGKV